MENVLSDWSWAALGPERKEICKRGSIFIHKYQNMFYGTEND